MSETEADCHLDQTELRATRHTTSVSGTERQVSETEADCHLDQAELQRLQSLIKIDKIRFITK